MKHRDTMRLALSLVMLVALSLSANLSHAQSLLSDLKSRSVSSLVEEAVKKGNPVRGAVLVPSEKLGCVNCHVANATDAVGPDLNKLDPQMTNEALVESLLDPSATIRKGFENVTVLTVNGQVHTGRILKQTDALLQLRKSVAPHEKILIEQADIDETRVAGSPMPSDLVDKLQDRQAFLDLLSYLMQLRDNNKIKPSGEPSLTGHTAALSTLGGLALIDQFRCQSCHDLGLPETLLPPAGAPDLRWTSGHTDPSYVKRFILDPASQKHDSPMPNLMAMTDAAVGKQTANQLTHYIASLSDRKFAPATVDSDAADRGDALFHSVGCVACHSPRDQNGVEKNRADSISFGNPAQKYNIDSLSEFLEDPHSARPDGRMPNLQLTHWEAIDIANYLLTLGEAAPKTEFVVDAKLAEAGRDAFVKLQCNACHTRATSAPKPRAVPVNKLSGGCLSGESGAWPKFVLNESQRKEIAFAITAGSQELTLQHQIQHSLTTQRCTSCHARGNLKSISDERSAHFKTTNPNLGPQGRIPPTLTNVGAKLNAKWMRQVLIGGRSIRPYMSTRMPKFGEKNVVPLLNALQSADKLPATKAPEFSDLKTMRTAGHQLVGTNGLNCIACHTFQLKPAHTMPAVDLTEMSERLQKDWFVHYMRSPQLLSPGTVMPSFWPGGRAIREEPFNSDSDLQLEAIWQYLLDGRQARSPQGLIRKPMELLATDEAVMLRRSYRDVGKRGIGVGYPGEVNQLFDAEQMRIAMLWKGKFADPGGVWRSQGHGVVNPIGRERLAFTKGPDFDDAANPWVPDDGRPPEHQFKGYDLDSLQRPTFQYIFEDIKVTDKCKNVADSGESNSKIARTVILDTSNPRPGVRFRIASAKKIVQEEKGIYRLDEGMRVVISPATTGTIEVADLETQELHLRLDLTPGKTELNWEYSW